MKIYRQDTGEAFDLPVDFNPDKEWNNPLMSEYGAQTIPVTIPMTNKNKRLTGFPAMLSLENKPDQKIRVIVEDKGIQRLATMILNSSTGDMSVGFDEGDAYSKMSEIKLKDTTLYEWLPMHGDTEFINSGVGAFWGSMTQIYRNSGGNKDFYAFPVLLKREENAGKRYYTIINAIEEGSLSEIRPLRGRMAYQQTVLIDGSEKTITFPKNYGIAPFLRLYRLLDIVCTYMGYDLVENAIETHDDLKRIAVLHNCMDCGCKDYVPYSLLMPDCTISELFEAIKNRFGAICYFDGTTMTARIRLIKDIISDTDRIDISAYADEYSVEFEKPKHVVLSVSNSLENTETQKETFDKFAKKHFNLCNKQVDSTSFASKNIINLRQRLNTGDYYKMKSATNKHEFFRVSSNMFAWEKTEKELNKEEFSAVDESVTTFCEDVNRLVEPGSDWSFLNDIVMPFYSVGPKNVTTTLRGCGDAKDDDSEETPLAFAYYCGQARTATVQDLKLGYFYGSTQPYDNQGITKIRKAGLYPAGADGLFMEYWKDYDAMLRHSNHKYIVTANIPYSVFSRIQLYKPIVLHGQPCLIERITQAGEKYELTLRSISLKKPYDLDEEQSIPVMNKQTYYWQYWNDEQAVTDGIVNQVIEEAKDGGNNTVELRGVDTLSKESPVENEFSFVPPPQDSNATYILKYKKRINVRMMVFNGHGSSGRTVERSFEYSAGVRSVYDPNET